MPINSREREKEYWDRVYRGKEYAYGTEPNRYLVAQLPYLQPGMKALVIGDGEGRNGVWLASQGLDVVSVDLSPYGLEKARLLARYSGISLALECCDLLVWRWPRSAFDVAVAVYVHLEQPGRTVVHRNIVESLRPNGLLILEAFHRRHVDSIPDQPQLAECFYDAATLRRDFKSLKILELMEGYVRLDEGPMHQGDAEIVRVLARKTSP